MSRHSVITGLLMLIYSFSAVDAAENELTEAEKSAGWILLFDGRSVEGWMDSRGKPIAPSHVQENSLNPHPCNYMIMPKEIYDDFRLSLEFRLSRGCNSGVFVRTFPLETRPGRDIGYNGLEVAIDDTTTAGFHDTGAIYDLVRPAANAMKPVGEWNHMLVRCDRNLIEVSVNGTDVARMDLDEWKEVRKRPDGTPHKFDTAWRDHPRRGYVGLQDHGSDIWYRNIKLLKLRH